MAVFLAGNGARFTFPDGRAEERNWEAGSILLISIDARV